MALRLREGVLRDTLTILQSHGAGCQECVVYWSAPLDDPYSVDQVLHPDHRATADSYEVASSWVTRCWICLARERRALRAQLHTHGGLAFHSAADDRHPIVREPGFLSLVLPDFARAGFAGARAYELQSDGSWSERWADQVVAVAA